MVAEPLVRHRHCDASSHSGRQLRVAADILQGRPSKESWAWLETQSVAMLGERTALVLRLISDDAGPCFSHGERQRMQLRVWSLTHGEWPAPPRETMAALKARMRTMWLNVVNANGLHFWARIFLDLHADPVRVPADDSLALAMASHARLGTGSLASRLGPDILRLVQDELRVRADADAQAVFEAKYALWRYYIKMNHNEQANVLFYFRLHASDMAQYACACHVFLADINTDPVWCFLLED
jgi:hypothetical protein